MKRARTTLIWGILAVFLIVPVAAAAMSPLLAWREPIYIAAGFAGVIAMALLLMQPLFIGGLLPGLTASRNRQLHRWIGSLLVVSVIVHVAALWITSPPDVIDALLFVSPTPFSAWGVVAMWAVFGAALLVLFRQKLRLRPRTWRLGHATLVTITVTGSVVHAILIEGTMETFSKFALCASVVIATGIVLIRLRNHLAGTKRHG